MKKQTAGRHHAEDDQRERNSSCKPVYFYSIDAQMKALIDRTLARWPEVMDKEFYYIVICADTDKASQETTLACFRDYDDCVEGAKKNASSMGPAYISLERSKRVLSLNRRKIAAHTKNKGISVRRTKTSDNGVPERIYRIMAA